jgi:hypothetical protein
MFNDIFYFLSSQRRYLLCQGCHLIPILFYTNFILISVRLATLKQNIIRPELENSSLYQTELKRYYSPLQVRTERGSVSETLCLFGILDDGHSPEDQVVLNISLRSKTICSSLDLVEV